MRWPAVIGNIDTSCDNRCEPSDPFLQPANGRRSHDTAVFLSRHGEFHGCIDIAPINCAESVSHTEDRSAGIRKCWQQGGTGSGMLALERVSHLASEHGGSRTLKATQD
jgi:hypothetical protein